jgi:hypothetical protein
MSVDYGVHWTANTSTVYLYIAPTGRLGKADIGFIRERILSGLPPEASLYRYRTVKLIHGGYHPARFEEAGIEQWVEATISMGLPLQDLQRPRPRTNLSQALRRICLVLAESLVELPDRELMARATADLPTLPSPTDADWRAIYTAGRGALAPGSRYTGGLVTIRKARSKEPIPDGVLSAYASRRVYRGGTKLYSLSQHALPTLTGWNWLRPVQPAAFVLQDYLLSREHATPHPDRSGLLILPNDQGLLLQAPSTQALNACRLLDPADTRLVDLINNIDEDVNVNNEGE